MTGPTIAHDEGRELDITDNTAAVVADRGIKSVAGLTEGLEALKGMTDAQCRSALTYLMGYAPGYAHHAIAQTAGWKTREEWDATDQVRSAITVIAREAIHHVVGPFAGGPIEWEDWPEIGEDDWLAVRHEVAHLTPSPARAEFDAAYELLKMRADH